MAWVVTLQIVSCSSPSTYLAGATINDGYTVFFTDANGQFIAIVDNFYSAYIISISKSGYLTRNYTLSSGQNGSIQTVCLNSVPPPDGGDDGNGGGW
jgi:hypothetical protein